MSSTTTVTKPALSSQQTATMDSPTVSYVTFDLTTDDSTSAYTAPSQNTGASSFQPTQSLGTGVSTTNAGPARTLVLSQYVTTRSVSSGTTQGNSPGGNIKVSVTTLRNPVVAPNTTGTTSTPSSGSVSSTARKILTTGKQSSTLPLNRVTGNTGVSQSPAFVSASLSSVTVPQNSQTNGNGCGAPPSVDGAKIISSGPYRAGVSAVYACLSGYTLSGAANILCGADLKWSQPLPQCIGPSGRGGAGSHTGLEEELTGMPIWLAIIVGVAIGVICLLLLTCLLIMCLRIFGCWKGSFFDGSTRRSSQIYPEKTPLGVTRTTSAMVVNEKEIDDKSVSKGDSHILVRDSRFHGNGRPPEDDRLPPQLENTFAATGTKRYTGQIRKSSYLSPPLINVSYDVPNTRRQAKMPERKKWMPHSRGVRNFNTSTK